MRLPIALLALLPAACSSQSPNTTSGTSAVPFAIHALPTDGRGVLVEIAQADFDLHQGTGVSALAVSDNYLYLSVQWSGIYRMPKLGGVVTVLDEGPNATFLDLAANHQYVFWDRYTFDEQDHPITQIRRQAHTGGVASTVMEGAFGVPTSNIPPSHLQATSSDLYLSDNPAGSDSVTVEHIPVSGGAPATPVFSWNVATGWPHWAVDDLGLFMSISEQGPSSTTGCKLWTFEGAEPAQRELAPCPEPNSQLVALDGDSLFFTSAHSAWKMPRTGGAPVAIATTGDAQYLGWNLVVDQANAYFTLGDEGIVWVPKTGGAITKLIDGSELPGGVSAFAQDNQYLYVLCGYRQVVVVPKPRSNPS